MQGRIRDGRLVGLRVTTLDGKPEDLYEDDNYESDPLSDLQPDAGSVKSRGPLTDRGLRAGDDVAMMLEAYGSPDSETAPSPIDAVDYGYQLDGGSLLVHADGSGTVRRLELRQEPEPSC